VLALALTPESRQIVHGLTALVLVAVLAWEGLRWPAWGAALVGVGAVVSTKAWLSLNGEGFAGSTDAFPFPAQRYFMNLGPWMTYESYLLQGGIALAVTLALVLMGRHARPMDPDTPLPHLSPGLRRTLAVAAAAAALCGLAEIGTRAAVRRRLTASAQG